MWCWLVTLHMQDQHDAAQLDHAFESGGHCRHDTNGGAGHRREQCCVFSDRCSETRQEGRDPVVAIASKVKGELAQFRKEKAEVAMWAE